MSLPGYDNWKLQSPYEEEDETEADFARMQEEDMTEEEKVLLDPEAAIAMLPDGDRIHTFRNPNGFCLGADWDRTELIETIQTAIQRELAGPLASAMGHGLVVWTDERSPLFVETRKDANHDES